MVLESRLLELDLSWVRNTMAGDKFGDKKPWGTGASQWLRLSPVVILDEAQMKGEALAYVVVVALEW